jgi:uncharacterized protein YlxP (DUF503 family)
MSVGILTLTFYLPDCHSLKEKRRHIKPILARLHKEFNISVIEYDHQDVWQTCQLLITCAAREGAGAQRALSQVVQFYESHWPDLPLTDEKIEILI